MNYSPLTESDLAELREPRPVTRQPDPIDLAVGSAVFSASHRFGLQIERVGVCSPRLRVSRYYFAADPPTAVDFLRDLRGGALYSIEEEIAAKREYFEGTIRYVIAADEFDEDALRPSAPIGESDEPPSEVTRPLTAPRRSRG